MVFLREGNPNKNPAGLRVSFPRRLVSFLCLRAPQVGAAEAHPLSPAAAGAWEEKAVEDGEVTGKTMGKCHGKGRKTVDFTGKYGFYYGFHQKKRELIGN